MQYTSLSFGKKLEEAGIVASMGSVGSAYDNAMAESFVATLKSELLYREHWPTREAVRIAIFEYLESVRPVLSKPTERGMRGRAKSFDNLASERVRLPTRANSRPRGELEKHRPHGCDRPSSL